MSDKLPNLEVPEQMRTLAENSVGQAKKAFDDFISATQDAVHRMDVAGRHDNECDLPRARSHHKG